METSKTCSDVPNDTQDSSSTSHKNELSDVLQSHVAMPEDLEDISNQKNVTVVQGDGENNTPVQVGESIVVSEGDENVVINESGDDVVITESGDNIVITDSGDNVVITDSGDNVVIAESGDNVVIAESGDNIVITESGDNVVMTETDDNVVIAEETVNENVVIAEETVNESVVIAEETVNESVVIAGQVMATEEESTVTAAHNAAVTQRVEGDVINEELKTETVSEVDVPQTQNIVEEILHADCLETVTESVVLDGLHEQEVVTTSESKDVGTVIKNDQIEAIVTQETIQESAVTSAEVTNSKIDEAVAEYGKTATFIGNKEEALDHLKIIMQDFAGIPSTAETSQQHPVSKTENASNEKTEVQGEATDQQPSSMFEQVQQSLVSISSQGTGVSSDRGVAVVASESESSTNNPGSSEQQTFSLTSAETAQLEQTVVANENTGAAANEVGPSVSSMPDQLSNVDGPQNSISSATEQHSVIFSATQASAENELAASLSQAANDALSQSEGIAHGSSNTDIAYGTEGQAVANNTGNPVTEEEPNADDGSDKPKKSGSFSLGVPGLSFSSQNVRVAHDGTKLVQIHQSQITPDQLQALQSNPNIKVVFRHIPSGKSFTKPPKNLFNTLGKSGKTKRKSENMDDSVYNFDDDFSNSSYDSSSATPMKPREDAKYARYNPNVGIKKRRPGRPRSIPDPNVSLSHSKMKSPALPTQLVLSEALCKLNKTNPNVHTLKLHISQVNLEILERMDLSPEYNIAITTKHEVSAEDQLKELAQEWADKEDTVKPVNLTDKPSLDEALASHSLLNDKLKKEQNELKNKAAAGQSPQETSGEATPLTSTVSPVAGSPTSSSSPLVAAAANHHRGPSMITVTKPEPKKRSRKKNDPGPMSEMEAQMRQFEIEAAAMREREREDAEIVASLHEQTSRSGRKRKPTRFSLDIARLTKKRPGTDDDFIFSSPSTPPKPAQKRSAAQSAVAPVASEVAVGQPPKKRPRGRPSRQWLLEQQKAEEAAAVEAAISAAAAANQNFTSPPAPAPKKELTQEEIDKLESDPTVKPRVMISLADQQPVIDHMIKLGLMPKLELKKPKETQPEAQPAAVASVSVDPVQQPEKPARNVGKKTKTKNKKQESNVLDLVASFFGQQEETSEMEVDAPAVDVPLSATDGMQQAEEKTGDQTETEEAKKADEEVADSKAEDADTKISVVENPSDILARKLNLLEEENECEDASKPATSEPSASKLTDFIEEEGDVDNKYRLRKLLQQCSIEEIISVAIPQALNSISIGDFFLYKSGQMSKKKVSFAQMYKQLESLHSSVLKESQRYSTLLRRANKVGGDRRLDKVILMPVYNKQAADALQVNLTSIDAHIGFIQQKATSQMIAANSFRLNCKMEPPVHRLELPDLADKKQLRKKGMRAEDPPTLLYGTSKKWSQSSQRSYGSTIGRANSMATGYKSRGMFQQQQQRNKPSASGAFMTSATTVAAASSLHHPSAVVQQQEDMQEHARLQLVSRHQSTYEQQRAGAVQNQVDASMLGLTQMPGELTTTSMINSSVVSSTQASAVEASQQQASVVAAGGANVVAGAGVEQAAQLMMEDGSIMTAEEGKQLVSIGDGQYFELPEGYTLIQTDEGYIIGQPGATFVQGEDGNVYMTSGEDATEIATTDQMLATTTANSQAETGNAEELLQQLNQT